MRFCQSEWLRLKLALLLFPLANQFLKSSTFIPIRGLTTRTASTKLNLGNNEVDSMGNTLHVIWN